jgi:hypothetical protein
MNTASYRVSHGRDSLNLLQAATTNTVPLIQQAKWPPIASNLFLINLSFPDLSILHEITVATVLTELWPFPHDTSVLFTQHSRVSGAEDSVV